MTGPQFTTQKSAAPDYPVTLDVAYPDRPLNRTSTFFRLFAAIPILIVLGAVSGGASSYTVNNTTTTSVAAGGLLVIPTLLMIVFREKYPKWWFDFNLQLARFTGRVWIYLALMDDRYPSTDEEQSLTLEIPYPDAKADLNRLLPLVKWLLAIPHFIVLFLLGVAAFVAVIFAWFAILFTGRYPRGIFDFLVGVLRWTARVSAYAFLLTTDQYPPFRLE